MDINLRITKKPTDEQRLAVILKNFPNVPKRPEQEKIKSGGTR